VQHNRAVLKFAVLLVLGFGVSAGAQNLDFVQEDPAAIVTAESCGECHIAEAEVWKKSPHATGFKTLHRKKNAADIAERMGFSLIKRDSLCLSCHFTTTVKNGQLRAVAGVSCESCHGAGREWIDIHNNYGKGFDYKTESPEHRKERIARSRAAGMRRPSDLYGVATSCYGCHTVPQERLVNVGRHSIGSAGFELVEWSQGIIRHNFLRSFLEGDGTENAEISPQRRRLLYVVGRAVDFEYSLRGVAAATEEGVYLKAMQRRLRNASRELRAIQRRGDLPEIVAMLNSVQGLPVALGRGQEFLAAADKVGKAARLFLEQHDGGQLANLDPLVDGVAEDFDDPPLAVASAGGTGEDPSSAALPSGPTATGSAATSNTSGETRPAVAAVPAAGEIKTRIRPQSGFSTVSASECQRCHGDQNAWWFNDAHSTSADPFFEGNPNNVKIARLYGINPAKMSRGETVCMDCHGTVVTGKERREVDDGVSCQSCHGPGKEFLEIHQEGELSLGAQRPGYVEALKRGMVKLQDLDVRARICSSCHYVTDPRLISAGHPSGATFDYVAGMNDIRHWERSRADPASLRRAFGRAITARGVVPEVVRARFAIAPGSVTPGIGVGSQIAEGSAENSGADPAVSRRRQDYRPASSGAAQGRSTPTVSSTEAAATLRLPPFPEISRTMPVEEILLLVKERLDLLYQAVGRGEVRGDRR
jgi:hypothetical protein